MSDEQEDNLAAAREFIKSLPTDNMTKVPIKETFWDIKVGDTVVRMLAGIVRMEMIATKIEGNLIHVNSADNGIGGWTFDRDTGIEVDEDLGWGVDTGITGSYLVKEADENPQ